MRFLQALIGPLSIGSLLIGLASASAAQRPGEGENAKITARITFMAEDGVKISADLYARNEGPRVPYLLLFHDGSASRAQYRNIAPRFSRKGYNALAVDLRSGGATKGFKNITHANAASRNFGHSIVDAEQDVVAALAYARATYPESKLVAIGSSYSASLVLRVAATRPELVDGVACFSAAEYFEPAGQSPTWIEDSVGPVACPVFMTSARIEDLEWKAIFEAVGSSDKTAFLPTGPGAHGASALNKGARGFLEYWTALESFLVERFPPVSRDAADTDATALERVVVIGASLSDGFQIEAKLHDVIEVMIQPEHEPIVNGADSFVFANPVEFSKKQIELARATDPTLLVALDFLFWFGYGTLDPKLGRLAFKDERLQLLERGLSFLDEFDCPIVVGDFPNMAAAVGGGMLSPSQLPDPESLEALNARLRDWAAANANVVLIPLARVVEDVLEKEPFRVGRHRWPADCVDRMLLPDMLHPTIEGLAAIAHLIGVNLVDRELVPEGKLETDLVAVLDELGEVFEDAGEER